MVTKLIILYSSLFSYLVFFSGSISIFMGWPERFLFAAFLIAAAAIHGTHGGAMVGGTVFCDQCKDGQISLFDYPLNGMMVSMSCPGSDGQYIKLGEASTNFLGNYAMRFDGAPDLSGCYAQVSGNGQGCGAVAGSAQNPRLMFGMFDMEMYSVDPLLSQPAQPMSFCPRSANYPVRPPVTPATRLPPPATPTPTISFPPPAPTLPTFGLPPMPKLPPLPPMPFFQASACPYQKWVVPENKCYWRSLSPDLKVALVFGPAAARRYGTDITLWTSMRGRGDPYKTLLREATTALLNSYNSVRFPYNPLSVITRTNLALMGSTRQVLITALRFMRANSGNGNATCRFTPCN